MDGPARGATDSFMTLDWRFSSNLDVRIPTGDGNIWSVGAKNMGAGYVCIRLIASHFSTTGLPIKADAKPCKSYRDERGFCPFPGGGAEPRFPLLPLQIRCQHGARVDQSVEIGFADRVQGQGGLFQRAVMVHGVMRDF